MSDALLALLAGSKTPTNAVSFMDPFSAYDWSGLVARGLKFLTVGNRLVVGGGGYANEETNIAQASPKRHQVTGQTGTLTKKEDGYLGGRAGRPSIEWSADTDLKVVYDSNFLPATGEWWKFGSITPLVGSCFIFGQSDSAKAKATIVNTEIRLNIANSGSGGFSAKATPDASNLINRSFGYRAGRRASDNFLVVSHHLAGAVDGNGDPLWIDSPATQAATSGAGGTGSALTIPADVIEGCYVVQSGYSAYARRQVDGWWVGTMSADDWATIRQIIDLYSGL